MKVLFNLIFNLIFLINLNSLDLISYKNSREDISFDYPKNWFIKEMMFNNPYYIFISDVELKNDSDIFKTGITITKFYHQSWLFKFDPDFDKSLDNIKKINIPAILSNKGHKIISEEIVKINDIKFLKVAYVFNDSKENLTIINYYTIYNDSYLSVVLEAPTDKIPLYNDFFNNFINKSTLFTSEKNDNHIVDSQSFKITQDLMKLDPSDKDGEQYLYLMSLAVKMNPFFPYLYYGRGIYYMKICQNLKGQKQKEFSKITIDELKKASEYFVKYGKDITDEKNLKFPLSQCYYLIAEVYRNALKDKNNAKIYYEKALEITDSKQIRDSLNNL